MFVTISARTYYQSSSWPNIIVAVNSYQKTLNKTDLSRVPTSKPQAKSLPNMTSLWRSTFFSMESLFNCSATLETIHSKITSHLLKAKTWKTRERLVSLLRDLRLLVLWKITSKRTVVLYKWHTWSWHPQYFGSATKKDQTDESLANAAAARTGGRTAETTKRRARSPDTRQHSSRIERSLRGLACNHIERQQKTPRKIRGKKSYLCLREVGEDTTNSRSHGGLNDTNIRSLHLFQKLALPENWKRHMRHHFSRLMASLIELSRKAHPQRAPSLPPLSTSLHPSLLGRSAARRPATAAFSGI